MRVRITLRRSMGLVALVALGLLAYEEFQDGSPPRFVVRSIPDRIARLRPGMTYEEAEEILGLEKSWLRGGLSAAPDVASINGSFIHATSRVGRMPRRTTQNAATGPIPVAWTPPPEITLNFVAHARIDANWKHAGSTRLTGAYLVVDGQVVARMPE